jgi:hypothetical protein
VEVLEALGLSLTPGEIAGLLIARSLLEAMKKLLKSNAWATLFWKMRMSKGRFSINLRMVKGLKNFQP